MWTAAHENEFVSLCEYRSASRHTTFQFHTRDIYIDTLGHTYIHIHRTTDRTDDILCFMV